MLLHTACLGQICRAIYPEKLEIIIQGLQVLAFLERFPCEIAHVLVDMKIKASLVPLVIDNLFHQPLPIIQSAKVVKHVRLPMWEKRIIIGVIRAKLATVKLIMQVPCTQL